MLLYKGPNTAIENIIDCSVNSRCTLDQNSGKLTFHDFQPSNASNYTIRYNNGINTHCLYKFALEVAGEFILSYTIMGRTKLYFS